MFLLFFAIYFISEVSKPASYQLLVEAEGWPVEAAFYAAKLAAGCKFMRLDQTEFFAAPKKITWVLGGKPQYTSNIFHLWTIDEGHPMWVKPPWQMTKHTRWNKQRRLGTRTRSKKMFCRRWIKFDPIGADSLIRAGVDPKHCHAFTHELLTQTYTYHSDIVGLCVRGNAGALQNITSKHTARPSHLFHVLPLLHAHLGPSDDLNGMITTQSRSSITKRAESQRHTREHHIQVSIYPSKNIPR